MKILIEIPLDEGGEDDGFFETRFSKMSLTTALKKSVIVTFTQSMLFCTNFATDSEAE